LSFFFNLSHLRGASMDFPPPMMTARFMRAIHLDDTRQQDVAKIEKDNTPQQYQNALTSRDDERSE
jgi:hypothetical protein